MQVTETSAYSFAFIPVGKYNPVVTSWTRAHHANYSDGFFHLSSSVSGGQIKFYFRGRRIGVEFGRAVGNGILTFDVDGTAYGTVDTAIVSGAVYGGQNCYIISADLPPGDHILTVTKSDASQTSVQGFFVDTASSGGYFNRAALDYHQALNPIDPISIAITDTVIRAAGVDFWMLNAAITNTTAAAINVTLKNNAGAAVAGPFSVAANDCRVIPGPLYFNNGMKASASATGCIISAGGQ